MAGAAENYPSTLPNPQITTFRAAPEANTLRTTVMGGPARFRNKNPNAPTIVNVQWILSQDQFNEFVVWFEQDINYGETMFNVSLRGPNGFSASCANFIGKYGYGTISNQHFRVEGQLELRAQPTTPGVLSVIDAGLYSDEFPDIIDAGLSSDNFPDLVDPGEEDAVAFSLRGDDEYWMNWTGGDQAYSWSGSEWAKVTTTMAVTVGLEVNSGGIHGNWVSGYRPGAISVTLDSEADGGNGGALFGNSIALKNTDGTTIASTSFDFSSYSETITLIMSIDNSANKDFDRIEIYTNLRGTGPTVSGIGFYT